MTFEDYFQAYKDYFWVWEDNAEVISISRGSTIAYREFLASVLESLSEQGLPPFGALLLAIIATNQAPDKNKGPFFNSLEGKRNTPLQKVEAIILETIRHDQYNDQGLRETLTEALSFLNMLSNLPPQYTTGAKRIQLFQTLFASCHNMVSAEKSKALLLQASELLSNYRGNFIEYVSRLKDYSYANFHKDFRCIGLLGKKFTDPSSIIEHMANVPEVKEPILPGPPLTLDAEPKKPLPEDLVRELIENPKTFHVGSLIKMIRSGLSIPMHHNLPSSQPLGGISDLTNKGDFDKLLIAEFANEDIILLSRLANNEALYLHRETPPHADDQERIILLDLSLRNWGTPKVLAFAILLAIAKHPKTDIHCAAFAIGRSYHPIRFDQADEIIESLQLLDDSLHSAMGLELFFKEYKSAKKPEIIFIASRDVFRLPAIQHVISGHRADFKYWITTDEEGNIELFKNLHNNRKLVQHIQLPLQTLWKKDDNQAGPPTMEGNSFMRKYPILYPVPLSIKGILPVSDFRVFVVTGQKKLFRLYGAYPEAGTRGWELILENVPASPNDCALGKDENGDYLLLCFNIHNKELTLINLNSNERKTMIFNDWAPSSYRKFFYHDQERCFYYIAPHYSWKIQFYPIISLQHDQVHKRSDLEEIYDQRAKELEAIERKVHSITYQGIRNINKVFINRSGHLVINKHELLMDSQGNIRLQLTVSETRISVISAEGYRAKGEFRFPDGSTVTVDPAGMLLVKSAPAEEGALFEVILKNKGANTLRVVMIIRENTGLGLEKSNRLANTAPCSVTAGITQADAEKLKTLLVDSGAEAEIKSWEKIIFIPCTIDKPLGVATYQEFAGNDYFYYSAVAKPLNKTDTNDFFRRHIDSFVRQIQKHGTKH